MQLNLVLKKTMKAEIMNKNAVCGKTSKFRPNWRLKFKRPNREHPEDVANVFLSLAGVHVAGALMSSAGAQPPPPRLLCQRVCVLAVPYPMYHVYTFPVNLFGISRTT